jgi:hypothetical protein
MPTRCRAEHPGPVNPRFLSAFLSSLVIGIDLIILGYALYYALQTHQEIARTGPDTLVGLGYFIAMLVAAVAVPSLVLAITALLTRGAAAVACSILSVISLAACAVFAVSYV